MEIRRRGFFYQLGKLLAQAKIAFFEGLYSPHIRIRQLHDKTYAKAGWYKQYSDKRYSSAIHKAAFTAFILSFAVFSVLNAFLPYLFNITKPREVVAGSSTYTWTTQGDFNATSPKTYVSITGDNAAGEADTGASDEVQISVTSGGNTWATMANAPSIFGYGGSLCYPNTGDYIYANEGAGGNKFYRYKFQGTSSDTWETMANTPGGNGSGSSLSYPNTGDYIYVLGGSGTAFWRYKFQGTSSDTWETMANVPGSVSNGGALTYPGTGDYLYAFQGGTNVFWRYKFQGTSSNTWETMANAPGSTSYGGSLSYPGIGDYIYALGGNSTAFWRYKFQGTSSNTWETMASTPTGVLGGSLSYPGAGDYIYALKGNSTTTFWRYKFQGTSSDTWETMANIPLSVGVASFLSYPSSGGYIYAIRNSNNMHRYLLPPVSPYNTSGTLGGSGGSDIGLRKDAGAGAKAKWSSIEFNVSPETGGLDAAGQAIKFAYRTSDDGATWSSLKGRDGNDIGDWSTNYLGQIYGGTSYSTITNATPSRYIDIVTQLSSSGADTPTLKNVKLTYNTITAPTNLKQYRSGGSTEIATAGYTNESTSVLKADVTDAIDNPSTLTPQIEMNITGNFTGTPGTPNGVNFTASDISYIGSPITGATLGTVTGFSPGNTYYWKVRYIDGSSRASVWSDSSNNFIVEQESPTGSVTINSGAEYTNSANVTLALSASDTGNSGLASMRFSNDGTTWSGWEAYNTSKSWTLVAGDGSKTVYVQFKDNAGNVSGFVQSSNSDFNGGAKTDVTTSNGSLILGPADPFPDTYYPENTGPGLPGIQVAKTDLESTYTWGPFGSACVSPQCSGSPPALVTDNNINFSSYAARNACKAIGGYLPTKSQLLNINTNKASYGTFADGNFWTSLTLDNWSSWYVRFQDGYSSNKYNNEPANVRCIRTAVSPGLVYVPSGNLISSVYDSGVTSPAYEKVNWESDVPSGTSMSIQVRAGITATPDGNWTAWSANLSQDQSLTSYNGKRYIQYKVSMTANQAQDKTPTLYDMSIKASTSDNITLDESSPSFEAGTITSPTTGDTWAGGSTHSITWDQNKISDGTGSGLTANPITLKYSANGGGAWTQIATGEANDGTYSWKLPNITCVGTCKVAVLAVDALGNANTPADANTTTALFSVTADSTPPDWNSQTTLDVSPKYIDGSGYTWTKGTTNLSWDPGATDLQSGIDKYQILLDPGATLKEDNIHTTSKTTTFTEGTYTWYVNAVNGANFEANTKDALTRTMTIKIDATSPTASLSVLPLTGHGYTATNSNLVNLSVASIVDSGAGYKELSFSNDGNLWSAYQGATSFSSWDLTDVLYGGTADKGTKTVYLKIRDNVGNENSSISTSIVYEDTAPTNPTSVSASVGTNNNSTYSNGNWTGNSTADVSWSGATDAAPSSGIYRYEVYESKDDGSYSLLDTVAASPKVVTGLVDGHNYKYLIRTIDAAGNTSNHTIGETPGSVDLPDITNPEIPQSFSASGTDDTHVQISWQTAPENSTSHGGKADQYVVTRTGALGSSEPADENGTCSNNTYGNTIDTVSFEENPQYKGNDLYQISDTVTAQQWYYYRIRSSDAGSRNSNYVCYKARGNFAPTVNQNDISISVNNNHDANSVATSDTVTIGFKASDDDGRSDLDVGNGNASQRIKIQDGSQNTVLAYAEVTQNPPTSTKQNDNGNPNGYLYSYGWTVPQDINFGTYTVSINVKDSVAQGIPGENLHNALRQINFKIPATSPANFTLAGQSSTQLKLTWDKSANGGVVSYKIYRSTSAGDVENQTPQTKTLAQLTDNSTTWSYIDSNLDYNQAYFYKIRAVDVSSNDGAFSTLANKTTPTPAVPSNSAVKLIDASTVRQAPEVSENRFLLTWDAPVNDVGNNTTNASFSKYVIEKSENAGPFLTVSETTNLFFVDVGLASTTDYTYRLRTKDTFNNLSRPDLSPTRSGQPGAKPSVTVSSVTTSTSTARIKWTATQEAETQIVYSANQSEVNNPDSTPLTSGVGGRRDAGTEHDVTLTGLSPNTTYYYKVVSRNVIGYANDFTIQSFNTKNFTIQHSKAADVSTTTTTATINWRTGEVPSDSFVEYQLQANYGPAGVAQTAGNGVIVPANGLHTIYITGLRSNSRYSYKIRSMDEGKYVVLSGLDFFETKPFDTSQFTITPSSTNIAEQNITATSARIIWSTAIATTTWVDYGTSSGAYGQSAGNDNYNTQHVIELVNLTPGTTYYYRVRGKDSNDVEYVSPEYKFTAILKPKVSNVVVKEVGPYQATISWETNVTTDSVIDYGKDASYGTRQGIPESVKLHSMTIKNLEDNTTYHYRVVVRDQFGNESITADANFATPLDKEGPKIENVKIDIMPMGESDETAQAIISWSTSKPATTKVEYDEGVISNKLSKSSIEDTNLNGSHTVIIKELAPATTYRFRIVSRDRRENESKSQDYTFVTPAKEKSIWQLIVKSIEETFSWVKNIGQFFNNIGKKIKS